MAAEGSLMALSSKPNMSQCPWQLNFSKKLHAGRNSLGSPILLDLLVFALVRRESSNERDKNGGQIVADDPGWLILGHHAWP